MVTLFSVAILACSPPKGIHESEVTEGSIANNQTLADNSRNSLDWYGVYKGITPCADCEGIETTITLKRNSTFKRSLKYLGKNENSFFDEGNFEWDETGSYVTLMGKEGTTQMYQVGENVIFHLDQEGNRITGELANMYRLQKNPVDFRLENKKWVLIELRGKPVEKKEGQSEGFIEFDMETGMFSGKNTCNNFFGQYELMEGDRIKFGQAGSTLMACPDMTTEQEFMEVLKIADNYNVVDELLSLNRAKMAPLARFELAKVD
ncbi:copper resistance protein NlpE N-terminal domain-containing protein [Cecembia rubra]|nr:copper resistance protein NlpE N-terminal domain-containing protein [Cecembia rubra]